MPRDRDVRQAVHDTLVATDAFDPGGVWLWGLPEDYGTGTSIRAAVSIQPQSSTSDDRFDGAETIGIVVTSLVSIVVFFRDEDPQVRDEGVEFLFNTAADVLNGQSLGGLTLPDFTRFTSWRWNAPTAPERSIACTFTYQYLVDGWDGLDVDP
jgi:hypothetical protein